MILKASQFAWCPALNKTPDQQISLFPGQIEHLMNQSKKKQQQKTIFNSILPGTYKGLSTIHSRLLHFDKSM